MRTFLIAVTRNPISLLGAAITTASAVLILNLLVLEFAGSTGNPYIGILAYLVLPGVFIFGLTLMPLGVFWQRRRLRRARELGRELLTFPVIDLNVGRTRRIVLSFVLLTFINVIILSAATYKGVEVMESTEFCGTACHTVMEPEHTAYEGSPHARVKCVECHIGPGAGWFVKSKLSGAWQLVSVMFELYDRPIATPIHNLRPARETCEQCHWPDKFVGDRLWVKTHYSNDEVNTETKTVLLLRVGGIQGRVSEGIHWHVDRDIQVRYRSDASRETIYDVEMTLPDGTVKLYTLPDDGNGAADGEDGPEDEWRVMDCVDCHNRPTHVYDLPEEALDKNMQKGLIDATLPYIRREGLAALRGDYASHEEAREKMSAALRGFYDESHPDVAAERPAVLDKAIDTLGAIYSRNVFPSMNVSWGTYPDHIGHTSFPGCFRCHDDEHTTEDGDVISQDCFTCHTLLAMEEEDPEVLQMLQP